MIARLQDGSSPREAAEAGLAAVAERSHGGQVRVLLARALQLAGTAPAFSANDGATGGGWVAEEALAIAPYCFLVADDFDQAVILAANHSGDSDSTASITGQLHGGRAGEAAIGDLWAEGVEMAEVIGGLADRLAATYPS